MWNPFNQNNNQGYDVYGDPYGVQGYRGQYGGQYGGQGSMRVTKQDLVNYIVQNLGASDVVKCDEFETPKTRHICPGTKQILILNQDVFNVPTPQGLVPVGVFFCPNCRKLWIDKNTLDFM